jgi:hypothetical protein
MKSRPIIFSAEMVRALIAGRKTQTRRKIKNLDSLVADCPYGKAGGKLWVREVFAKDTEKIIYKADNHTAQVDWISPIFMPRVASRISLKITEVSIEWLQDINSIDALAEGIVVVDPFLLSVPPSPRDAYAQLWDSLAKPGYRWDDNPLVWVIKFEVQTQYC